jgi:hypothetical protein
MVLWDESEDPPIDMGDPEPPTFNFDVTDSSDASSIDVMWSVEPMTSSEGGGALNGEMASLNVIQGYTVNHSLLTNIRHQPEHLTPIITRGGMH